MGAVSFSIDPPLLSLFAKQLDLDVFVETGTFAGDSIERVKPFFKEIFSIELSNEYYEKARQRFKEVKNVALLQGDSSLELKKLQHVLAGRNVLYWLDAHWCIAENTAGESSQCPLLAELEAISALNENSLVLIDDARFFLAPPPYPHVLAHWPDFSSILQRLQALSARHAFRVVNDCILFFPQHLTKAVDEFAYLHGVDWNHIYQKSSALEESEKDRAARLVVINQLNQRIQELEAKKSLYALILQSMRKMKLVIKKIFFGLLWLCRKLSLYDKFPFTK